MTILEPLLADVPDLRWLLDVPEEELEVIWDELNPDERYALGAFLLGAPTGNKVDWQPLPHQIPPPPGWFLWVLSGGRGIGKTDAGAHYMDQHAMGPPCLVGEMPHRMAIVAPTLGDASEACVNGPSGIKAHNPTTVMTTRRGGSFVNWPNGSEARLLGMYSPQDVERCRAAGNRCLVWLEELCAWRYLRDGWDHIRLGLLREGPHPHAIATTTPKNRPTYKRLLKDKRSVVTMATTKDNPYLPTMIREALYETYGGTRLGLQELEGQVLEDVEGALWTQELIETRMRTATVPGVYERVVVAVDPSWGLTNDECGIIGAGRANKTGYVIADESGRMSPSDWGRRAAELYTRLRADRLLGEGNFQAEQVKMVAKTVNDDPDYDGDHVAFHLVYASRGKRLRAEPVLALCEQGRIKLVGRHVLLEHQLCTWVPPERNDRGDTGDPEDFEPTSDVASSDVALPSEFSPDRLDAFVFAMTDLLLGRDGPARIGIARGQLPDARGLAGRVGGMRPLGR